MANQQQPPAKKWINAKPKLVGGKLLYEQEKDCCDGGPEVQKMEVAIHDGGGGAFLTLKTGRWAFDSADELADMILPIQKAIAGFPSD